MRVNAESFQKQANALPEKTNGSDGVEHKVWVVRAPFWAMWYNSDARYFPRDATLDADGLNKPRQNKVQFQQGKSQSSTHGLVVLDFLVFQRWVTMLLVWSCWCIT